MEKMIQYIVGGLVVLVLAAVLLPLGISQIHSANTTGWSSGEVTLFGILGTMVLIGVVIGIIFMATKHK
jgi:hypothetical protein